MFWAARGDRPLVAAASRKDALVCLSAGAVILWQALVYSN